MPTKSRTADPTEVACPKCGHHFLLEDRIVDHLQEEWAKQERSRLKRELRAELSPEIEKLAQKQAEKLTVQELRESQEQLRERDNQIRALKRTVTTLQKKLPDGRAQELGVVRQQTLAEALETRFKMDKISVTPRGVAGADVVQVVRDPSGRACGSILWESKRAANWQKAWVRKLRADQKNGKHALAVIVSEVLPDPDKVLVEVDGVWVTTIDVACDIAAFLRDALLQIAAIRGTVAHRDDLKGLVYDYLTSGDFTSRIVSIVELAKRMRDELAHERHTFETRWTEREREIESIVLDIAAIYGDLKGIGASMPAVKTLELGPATD